MTQIELERKIENTRADLNAAIEGKMTQSRILDISRTLDGLIEEYLEKCENAGKTGEAGAACLEKGC